MACVVTAAFTSVVVLWESLVWRVGKEEWKGKSRERADGTQGEDASREAWSRILFPLTGSARLDEQPSSLPPSGLQTNYVTSENKSITFGYLLCKMGNLIIPKLSFVKPVNLCRLLDTCKNCVLLEVLFLSFALNKQTKKHIHDIYLEMLHILSSQNIPFSLLSVSSHPPLRKHTHTKKQYIL